MFMHIFSHLHISAYFRHFLNFCLDISFFDDMFFRVFSLLKNGLCSVNFLGV